MSVYARLKPLIQHTAAESSPAPLYFPEPPCGGPTEFFVTSTNHRSRDATRACGSASEKGILMVFLFDVMSRESVFKADHRQAIYENKILTHKGDTLIFPSAERGWGDVYENMEQIALFYIWICDDYETGDQPHPLLANTRLTPSALPTAALVDSS